MFRLDGIPVAPKGYLELHRIASHSIAQIFLHAVQQDSSCIYLDSDDCFFD